MSGFGLAGAPEYEAWQAQTTRRLEQLYLAGLARLVDLSGVAWGPGRRPPCIARQYLATDELDETIHRRLIGLLHRHRQPDCGAAPV